MVLLPRINPSVHNIGGTSFSELSSLFETYEGEKFPFYIGDTWLVPPDGCRMENLRVEDYPDLYRYGPSHGISKLTRAIAELSEKQTGIETRPENVVVTAGATGGIAALLATLLSPGEEILVPVPYWPLITGITHSVNARPVKVHGIFDASSGRDALEVLESGWTPRCRALFLNNPHNPTGIVLPSDRIEEIVAWAREKNLWIVSDEVYRDFVFTGTHTRCRPLAPERAFEIFSFSKAYGMAGNRCGYVVGPAEIVGHVRRVNTHKSYGAAVAAQQAAFQILDGYGDAWLSKAMAEYRQVGHEVAATLGVSAPASSLYLFLDLRERLQGRTVEEFHRECARNGVLLSPGEIFGANNHFVRLCFASAPPEQVLRGARILAGLLGPGSQ